MLPFEIASILLSCDDRRHCPGAPSTEEPRCIPPTTPWCSLLLSSVGVQVSDRRNAIIILMSIELMMNARQHQFHSLPVCVCTTWSARCQRVHHRGGAGEVRSGSAVCWPVPQRDTV